MVSPSTKFCWDFFSQPEARLAIAKGDRISTASAVQKVGVESYWNFNDLDGFDFIGTFKIMLMQVGQDDVTMFLNSLHINVSAI